MSHLFGPSHQHNDHKGFILIVFQLQKKHKILAQSKNNSLRNAFIVSVPIVFALGCKKATKSVRLVDRKSLPNALFVRYIFSYIILWLIAGYNFWINFQRYMEACSILILYFYIFLIENLTLMFRYSIGVGFHLSLILGASFKKIYHSAPPFKSNCNCRQNGGKIFRAGTKRNLQTWPL